TDEDVPFNFQSDHFAFNDSVDNNNFAGIVIASLPTTGTLTLSGSSVSLGQSINSSDISNLVFTPATNAYGTNNSSFSFKVFDDGGTDNGGQDTDQTAKIWTFNVNSVDDIAVFSGDTSGSVSQFAGAITGDLNATDVEGLTDSDYFSVSTNATNGIASINSETGAWSYVPTNSGVTGADSFIVKVTDDLGGTTTQKVDLSINAIQHAISATVRNLTSFDLFSETGLSAPTDNYYALDLDIDISAYTSLIDDVNTVAITLDPQTNPFEVIQDPYGDVYFFTSGIGQVTALIDDNETSANFGTAVMAILNGRPIVSSSNKSEDLGSIYFNLDDNLTIFDVDLIDIAIVETDISGGDSLILSPLSVDIL
ncbi:cadherin-like domain-containing protein, partial [Amylibacter sp.]|nr:cadherin-like domain-containing protein [Amylibacter sp.]